MEGSEIKSGSPERMVKTHERTAPHAGEEMIRYSLETRRIQDKEPGCNIWSNDSGNLSTDGSGVLTCTGLVLGNNEHITLGSGSTIQFTNGTTTNDILYAETASGITDIQTFGSGGSIRFKDYHANTFAAADQNVHGFSLADNVQGLHAVLYNNTGSGELYIQMSGSGNLIFKDNNGNNMAHIDHSGNLVLKGSLTQNGTP